MEIELTLEVIKAVKTLRRFAAEVGWNTIEVDYLGGLRFTTLGPKGKRDMSNYFSPAVQDMIVLQLTPY